MEDKMANLNLADEEEEAFQEEVTEGLMSKTMAPQFGSFLGDFLVYDTKVPTLGMKWYMRLK
ncbi:hypothetical protein Goari_012043, partial [Gossypium aridum]|nr:hypothetical protein [Gossypium aridum]